MNVPDGVTAEEWTVAVAHAKRDRYQLAFLENSGKVVRVTAQVPPTWRKQCSNMLMAAMGKNLAIRPKRKAKKRR